MSFTVLVVWSLGSQPVPTGGAALKGCENWAKNIVNVQEMLHHEGKWVQMS